MLGSIKNTSIAIIAVDSDIHTFCEYVLRDSFEIALFSEGEFNSVLRLSEKFSYVFMDLSSAEKAKEKDLWNKFAKNFNERIFILAGPKDLFSFFSGFSENAEFIKYPFGIKNVFCALGKGKAEENPDAAISSFFRSGSALSNVPELSRLIGNSKKVNEIKQKILLVADTDTPLIFFGESGTGKSISAQIVHQLSRRRERPFVHAMMGNGSKDLIESKLFGNVRGAFTDAKERTGLFRKADTGTLFMDEIADLSLEAQAKILRVIEAGVFRPVGSDEEIKVDVRLIFATNTNLGQMVRNGQFREDLYWRIADFPIKIPSLRERAEDIPDLAERTLNEIKRALSVDLKITKAALKKLCEADWPGNFRQFKACMMRAGLLSRHKGVIDQDAIIF